MGPWMPGGTLDSLSRERRPIYPCILRMASHRSWERKDWKDKDLAGGSWKCTVGPLFSSCPFPPNKEVEAGGKVAGVPRNPERWRDKRPGTRVASFFVPSPRYENRKWRMWLRIITHYCRFSLFRSKVNNPRPGHDQRCSLDPSLSRGRAAHRSAVASSLLRLPPAHLRLCPCKDRTAGECGSVLPSHTTPAFTFLAAARAFRPVKQFLGTHFLCVLVGCLGAWMRHQRRGVALRIGSHARQAAGRYIRSWDAPYRSLDRRRTTLTVDTGGRVQWVPGLSRGPDILYQHIGSITYPRTLDCTVPVDRERAQI